MKHVLHLLCAAALLGLAIGLPVRAAPESKGKTIVTKAEKAAPPAASIDFGQSLGLSLDSLRTIGSRIDQARGACDPVSLAGLAKELGTDEEISGKKASLTAKELTEEAVKMAKFRDRPDELRAVAKILGGGASDALRTQADKAAKADEQREKTRSAGKEKGITGYLIFNNNTRYYVTLYVNYVPQGTVLPWGTGLVNVGDDARDTTYLNAIAPGTDYVWSRSVPEPVADYTWSIFIR